MAVQLTEIFHSKSPQKFKALPLYANSIELHGDTYVVDKLTHSKVLRCLARSMLLALIFVTLLVLRTFFVASPFSEPIVVESESGSDSINRKVLSLLLHDLTNEGILKTGDKAMFVSNGNDNSIDSYSQIINDNDMDVISVIDWKRQNTIPDESFDFAFTNNFHAAPEFIDRTLKVGGIAVVQLRSNPSFGFNKPSNYKIVYLRRFETTILAMRKTDFNDTNSVTQRRLLGYPNEAKKAALKNLEDVLLEPPRAASGKSWRYLKRTRYLPDLMGDSLESYSRRVFIDVGLPDKEGGSGTKWFAKNYPTRNLDFEMYKIETVTEESSGKEVPQVQEVGMSDWLRKNVKEEEYVVMKAEAEVVEEMMKSKAIRLVDELFMECKPKGHGGKSIGSRRAYWECLALYGKLRDEGVAVHQWWG